MRTLQLFICFFLLLFTFSLRSQTPQSFQYQAVVRDAGGNPVAGQNVGMLITLLQGSAMGTSVYSEDHSATTNAFGIVTVSIGTGNVISGIFSTINWSAGPYFIKVEIDPAGGTSYVDMGTTQLLSVPYALYAEQSSSSINDNDPDPTNELQLLSVSNDTLYLSNGGFVSLSGYSDTLWRQTGNDIYNTNIGKVGIGTTTPPGKLVVQGDSTMADTIPLFEVKDRQGQTVFIIYPDSARLYVGDDGTKTSKGAFAVSGRNTVKQMTHEYLKVTPDSVRIFLDSTSTKGGFSVKSFGLGKKKDYMSVYVDTAQVIDPSVSRILWYPSKEAFLTGRVLIESPDSVGVNSWATGFESKSVGNWSQALGYRAIARGDYSTAIGKNALANDDNSLAIGDSAKALMMDSYAFGAGAKATGTSSYAFGSQGRDTLGALTGVYTESQGDYSFALGLGSRSQGIGSVSLGVSDWAYGDYSFAAGYECYASQPYSMALGTVNTAIDDYASSFGGKSNMSSGMYSLTAGGSYNEATDKFSSVIGGYRNTSEGELCIAGGYRSNATSYNSLVYGRYNVDFNPLLQPFSPDTWIDNEPLFVLGNGTGPGQFDRSNAMTVLKNGLVGINTPWPQVRLHIMGSSPTNSIILLEPSEWNSTGDFSEIRFGSNISYKYIRGQYGSSMRFQDADGFGFMGGNVGVGTDTPGNNLEVSDNGTTTIAIKPLSGSNNRESILNFWSTFDNYSTDVGTRLCARIQAGFDGGIWGTEYMAFGVANAGDTPIPPTERMRINANGFVGINTTTMSNYLTIEAAGNHMEFKRGGVGTWTFGINSNNTLGLSVNSGNAILRISNVGADDSGLELFRPGTGSSDWRMVNIGGVIYFQRSADDLATTTDKLAIGVSYVRPGEDNVSSCGTSTYRWTAIYAVNGTIQTSDARDKENVNKLNYGLKEVMQLNPVSFTWKDRPQDGKKLGFLAQDVEKVIKEVVVKDIPDEEREDGSKLNSGEEVYGMYYSDLIPVLVKSIQELNDEVTALKKEVETLKNK